MQPKGCRTQRERVICKWGAVCPEMGKGGTERVKPAPVMGRPCARSICSIPLLLYFHFDTKTNGMPSNFLLFPFFSNVNSTFS